ncbi:hypothetical protein D3C87_951840 [compost metagenome]
MRPLMIAQHHKGSVRRYKKLLLAGASRAQNGNFEGRARSRVTLSGMKTGIRGHSDIPRCLVSKFIQLAILFSLKVVTGYAISPELIRHGSVVNGAASPRKRSQLTK